MNQKEVLDLIASETHGLFTIELIDEINEAFGLKIRPISYPASPNKPKGLTLDDGAKWADGISALDAATILCQSLGVRHEIKMGRGSQVRVCVEALRAAGYGV